VPATSNQLPERASVGEAIQPAELTTAKPQAHIELWGKREIEVRDDGSASYSVKKGDTLWSISSDVLKSEHAYDPDYRPSHAEIQRTVKEIAHRNHIANPDRIDIAQRLELKPRTEPIITRDEKGHVTGVDYPNGRPAHFFDYDLEGNLTGVHDNDGLQWRNEEGKWHQFNDRGDNINSADTIRVTDGGDMTIGSSDGEIVIDHLGRGSMLMKDSQGRPTEIYYPDGRPSNTITYDQGGNPIQIHNDEGFEWRKGTNGWDYRSPRGEYISSADLIQVTSQGDIVWKSNDGSQVVLSRDGSTMLN
jgi:YD repeat-containing protein